MSTFSLIPQKRDFGSFERLESLIEDEEADTKTLVFPDTKRNRVSGFGDSSSLTLPASLSSNANITPQPLSANAAEIDSLEASIQGYDNWIEENNQSIEVLKAQGLLLGGLPKRHESQIERLRGVNDYYTGLRGADQARLSELLAHMAAPVPALAPPESWSSAPVPSRFLKPSPPAPASQFQIPTPLLTTPVPLWTSSPGQWTNFDPHAPALVTTPQSLPVPIGEGDAPQYMNDMGIAEPGAPQDDTWPSIDILSQIMVQLSQVGSASDVVDSGNDVPTRSGAGLSSRYLSVQEFIESASDGFDENVKIEDALKNLGLSSIKDRLDGMSILLLPHQILGVAWMLDRERSSNRGGILADEMDGPIDERQAWERREFELHPNNRSEDPACKTTLIGMHAVYTSIYVSPSPVSVAPVGLLAQWKSEIEMATNNCFKIFIYHGQDRLKDEKSIQLYDIVITSYHTLSKQVPMCYNRLQKSKAKKLKGDETMNDDAGSDNDAEEAKKWSKGLLAQFDWYRIVLDEAHIIRNRKTHVSSAVAELVAKYRWCLTGTPIVNGLNDAYPLFRFLNIRPWQDWVTFKDHISDGEGKKAIICATKLQAIFKSTMLRRKKDSLLDGKPLVNLPSRHMFNIELYFSPEEADIYKFVAARSNMVFNKYLREGTVLKNYAHVLIMLLRLRQICVHPCLIEQYADAFRTPEEMPKDLRNELQRASREQGVDFVERITQMIAREAEARLLALRTTSDHQESEDVPIAEESCPVCYEPLGQDALVTQCGHSFCGECLDSVAELPLRDDKCKPDERPCPLCKKPISKKYSYMRSAFEPRGIWAGMSRPVDSALQPSSLSEREADGGEQGCSPTPDTLEDERGVGSRSTGSDIANGPAPPALSKFLPSTKMQEMMKLLLEWRNQDSSDKNGTSPPQSDLNHDPDKVVIVSQWTSVLDLCASYLEENGFKHVMYSGRLSPRQRNDSIDTFMTDPKVTVMLMSLKAGGVGLNLTRANRVISLDLAWNFASENQAFDRVHRLGQQKKVLIHRLTIRNTVEARVLELQRRKQELAEGSLGEGSGKKINRFNVRELRTMFGLTGSRDGAEL
ncbi:P-loop containing nucleoside triphosphate hydrolase protein [Cantharellus anzutake]|uniref:P-loop containing nucleoside triphosphate hydrolase protein n=1 Tax=Cantharellus anzutake TaxID=1750568 RepID=UPI0019056505|nr:P-loop containing nucleoside triphosphate hydrolase protein [Cantharellus anzutake]KAF8327231.1 P-loop containing nucleoside triphosphate hydrolase protein [Cantharellus anzutake]